MNKTASDNNNNKETPSKTFYVKYMVSLRCKMIVKSELEKLDLPYKFSSQGAIVFHKGISQSQYDQLKENLKKSHLVLLNESESKLIGRIIDTVIDVIHHSKSLPKVNFMDLINKHTIAGDEPILKIFSDVKGMSVLQFIVNQKIERAKELMVYEDVSLTEIAEMLSYENKHYLVAQFKKITGLSPSYFKQLKEERMAIAQKGSNSAQTGS